MSCKNVQHMEEDLVTQYTGAVDKEWLKGEGVLSEATNTDDTWTLLRMKPAGLLKKGIEAQEGQPVPGWGGFNLILYPELLRAKLDTVL